MGVLSVGANQHQREEAGASRDQGGVCGANRDVLRPWQSSRLPVAGATVGPARRTQRAFQNVQV